MTLVNHIQNNGGGPMTNEKRPAEADRKEVTKDGNRPSSSYYKMLNFISCFGHQHWNAD